MSQYIHHVPGRLRVRSRAFRCGSEKAQAAAAHLRAMSGVRHVQVASRAGSITVHYDPNLLRHAELLATLEGLGCLHAASRTDESARMMGEMFGKALVGAVVQKAVERSARTLVGALL